MPNENEFSRFLDNVHERLVDRAEHEHISGLRRLGNVWRLNNAEATITQEPSPSDVLVTFRCGPDASRSSQYKAGSVEATADTIIYRLERLTR
jgi:hypothetical protein